MGQEHKTRKPVVLERVSGTQQK